MRLVLLGAITWALLTACGDEEGAVTCPDPEANEPYCCSEAGIPLYPVCDAGALVCPDGTRDCASDE